MSDCLIGLGSNLGDRAAALDGAVRAMEDHPLIRVIAKSPWIETASIGGPEGQGPYLNGAVRIETDLEPGALLDVLQRIEHDAGRTRETRWGPRTLDLDLLLYDDLVQDDLVQDDLAQTSPRLTIPHPRLAFRRFVLEPAAAVAAEMIHPTVGWTIGRLWEHLNESANVVALAGSAGEDKSRLAKALCQATGARRVVGEEARRLAEPLAGSSGGSPDTAIEFLQFDQTVDEGAVPRLTIVVGADAESAASGPMLRLRGEDWNRDFAEAIAAVQSIHRK